MLVLHTSTDMQAALIGPLDPALRALLAKRMEQLGRDYDGDLGELVQFLIVQPGDSIAAITVELGFSILESHVDRTPFGDPEFTPGFEWIADHGSWFELVYIFSDDGYGFIVFVQDDPGIEFDLHALCLEYGRCPPDGCLFDTRGKRSNL